MNDCSTCVVRNRAICASLGTGELKLLAQLGSKQNIKRGDTLMWEGDSSPVVANIITGVLKLSVNLQDGREQIVSVMYGSDFIGRPFGKHSPYSVTAMTDAELCVFTRSSFDNFLLEYPDLQNKLLRRTLDELDRARDWMTLLGKKSANERIATLLIELSERLNMNGCDPTTPYLDRFELPMDRQQIADILGLTIETVSRQLTRIKQEGIIDLPDRRAVIIKDRNRLKSIAEVA
ncbi:Crp/Fnr family transcriptional regulator [Parasphingorhabdus sp. JC815]|uniref:Crp/Fnr family transcriptional regulator n=1 Tax=Parasphingorhabdus sp. JC815 TaxID=3232140 RepID=UPI0034579747